MKKKKIPYDFIFDHLDRSELMINPMFGCYLIYFGNKMILLLRKRDKEPEHNGIYIATAENDFDSVANDIGMHYQNGFFKHDKKRWLFVPESDPRFEPSVLIACRLIIKKDKRIGREKL